MASQLMNRLLKNTLISLFLLACLQLSIIGIQQIIQNSVPVSSLENPLPFFGLSASPLRQTPRDIGAPHHSWDSFTEHETVSDLSDYPKSDHLSPTESYSKILEMDIFLKSGQMAKICAEQKLKCTYEKVVKFNN